MQGLFQHTWKPLPAHFEVSCAASETVPDYLILGSIEAVCNFPESILLQIGQRISGNPF
jgi:hypothetical protein